MEKICFLQPETENSKQAPLCAWERGIITIMAGAAKYSRTQYLTRTLSDDAASCQTALDL